MNHVPNSKEFMIDPKLGTRAYGVSKEHIYFVVDAIGSAKAAIAIAKRRFKETIEERDEISEDVQFVVGFVNIRTLSADSDGVMKAINSLAATGEEMGRGQTYLPFSQ